MTRIATLFALVMPIFAADYAREIADFRAARERSISSPDGWISLAGLSWLKEGLNRVGSDPASEVPLPPTVPARVGTIILKGGHADFRPAPGVKIQAQEMKEDSTILAIGTVKFDTVIDGLQEEDSSPGYMTFAKDGREYRLDAVVDEDQLFLIFRDQTSGKSTYAAARFLYAELPKDLKATSAVVLDFNKAINPPCVFTPYATCPLPPPQNRLSLAVTAGEL